MLTLGNGRGDFDSLESIPQLDTMVQVLEKLDVDDNEDSNKDKSWLWNTIGYGKLLDMELQDERTVTDV